MQLDLIEPIATDRKAERKRAAADAQARADTGMKRAEEHVERIEPGWCELACDAVRRYSSVQHGVFTLEMLRLVMEKELPPVPEKRVWGVVTRMAIKRGLIERVKGQYFPAASSNNSPKAVYRAVRGAA